MTKHTTRGMSWILKLFLFIVLPLVVFTLITSKTDKVASIRSFVVLTGSMEPTVPVGSIVYSQKSSTNAYDPGDIISFKNKNDLTVTHRIAGKKNSKSGMMYQTKGDANNVTDTDSLPEDKVIGKVIFQVPYVGRIINFVKTPMGFLVLIVFPTLLFIAGELWNIKKEIEKEVEKRVLAKVQNEKNP
jgi:signal peptidase